MSKARVAYHAAIWDLLLVDCNAAAVGCAGHQVRRPGPGGRDHLSSVRRTARTLREAKACAAETAPAGGL